VWLPSKVVLSAKHASLLVAAGASLAPGARLTLLLKHNSGVVYQVAGVAARPRGGACGGAHAAGRGSVSGGAGGREG
jgi:hypothetical protein